MLNHCQFDRRDVQAENKEPDITKNLRTTNRYILKTDHIFVTRYHFKSKT